MKSINLLQSQNQVSLKSLNSPHIKYHFLFHLIMKIFFCKQVFWILGSNECIIFSNEFSSRIHDSWNFTAHIWLTTSSSLGLSTAPYFLMNSVESKWLFQFCKLLNVAMHCASHARMWGRLARRHFHLRGDSPCKSHKRVRPPSWKQVSIREVASTQALPRSMQQLMTCTPTLFPIRL